MYKMQFCLQSKLIHVAYREHALIFVSMNLQKNVLQEIEPKTDKIKYLDFELRTLFLNFKDKIASIVAILNEKQK